MISIYKHLGNLWGKIRTDKYGVRKFHLLVCHLLDTAAVASAWISMSSRMKAPVFFTEYIDNKDMFNYKQREARVLFFVFLHDIGKIFGFFQERESFAPEASFATFTNTFHQKGKQRDNEPGHGACGAVLMEKFTENKPADNTEAPWFKEEWKDFWRMWASASVSHHDRTKDYLSNLDVGWSTMETINIRRVRINNVAQDIFLEFLKVGESIFLHPAGISLNNIFEDGASPYKEPSSIGERNNFHGFCSLCDWISSWAAGTKTSCPLFATSDTPPENLMDYFYERKYEAKKILKGLGVCEAEDYKKLDCSWEKILKNHTARGIQKIGVDMRPGTLVLIEASTGSGKTAASLRLALEALKAGCADSIIFALPTQATANSMAPRIKRLVENVLSEDEYKNITLSLVHGDKKEELSGNEESEWLSESSNVKMLFATISICTLDQILVSELPVRHASIGCLATSRSVMIIDEVHGYSAYTTQLLKGRLSRHVKTGGCAIVLSATMPTRLKTQFLISWGTSATTKNGNPQSEETKSIRDKIKVRMTGEDAREYPLVTVMDSVCEISFLKLSREDAEPSKNIRVELRAVEKASCSEEKEEEFPYFDNGIIDEIKRLASDGNKVFVIMNTVSAAQKTYLELKSREPGVPMKLFHARFSRVDRAKIEAYVIDTYGPDNKNVYGGSILVATQVAEQSLDIDCDVMFTQICPMDILIQRLGRLHRWFLPSRPSQIPRCIVLYPHFEKEKLASPKIFGSTQTIYGACGANMLSSTPVVLLRTLELIEKKNKITTPDMCREMVDYTYAPGISEEEFVDIPLATRDAIITAHKNWEHMELTAASNANVLRNEGVRINDAYRQGMALTRDGMYTVSMVPYNAVTKQLFDGSWVVDTSDETKIPKRELRKMAISAPEYWFEELGKGDGVFKISRFVFVPFEERGTTLFADFSDKRVRISYDEEMGLLKI